MTRSLFVSAMSVVSAPTRTADQGRSRPLEPLSNCLTTSPDPSTSTTRLLFVSAISVVPDDPGAAHFGLTRPRLALSATTEPLPARSTIRTRFEPGSATSIVSPDAGTTDHGAEFVVAHRSTKASVNAWSPGEPATTVLPPALARWNGAPGAPSRHTVAASAGGSTV